MLVECGWLGGLAEGTVSSHFVQSITMSTPSAAAAATPAPAPEGDIKLVSEDNHDFTVPKAIAMSVISCACFDLLFFIFTVR